MKILIINNQRLNQNRLSEFFRMKGHAATIASTVKEAKALIERETFDIALVDFRMLDGKGSEIVNLIKEKKPEAKIIGMSETEQSSTFYKAGADSFIKKPFNDKEILEILNRRTQQKTMSKKPRILIVDDQQELRESLSFILKEKYAAATAGSAKDALKYMDDYPVNLVLLDYEMPKIDGITALGEIRKRHPDTVVIMMSGFAPADITQKAFNLGVFGFFMKPFDIDKLLNTIDMALQKQVSKNS
jgi:DNA-binding NtrC family response regulator